MYTPLERINLALRRVLPGCVTLSQAVAFNMFLAFFPMLLFGLGIVTSSDMWKGSVHELPDRVRNILPPGSERIIFDYFTRRAIHPFRWMWLGFAGMLLAGTQVMLGLIQGFRVVERTSDWISHWRLNLRALILLSITIVPWTVFVLVTVFARSWRTWIVAKLGFPMTVRLIFAVAYHGLALTLALVVLLVIYRLGQPGIKSWASAVPGAAVATLLWWIVDLGFGTYMRFFPYTVVYGGLADAIGLLLWMYLTAIVLFMGAAYNAVCLEEDALEGMPRHVLFAEAQPVTARMTRET